jgi:hypothetical protein
MTLIDITYFKGDISLPGLMPGNHGAGRILTSVGMQDLNAFIHIYEAEYLGMILGRNLYRALLEGLEEEPPAQLWVDMKEALTHSGSSKLSPIAYYVYFFVANNGQSRTGMKGEKKDESTFADSVSNAGKTIMAWKHMQLFTLDFMHWLGSHWDDYRDYADNVYPCIPAALMQMANSFGI